MLLASILSALFVAVPAFGLEESSFEAESMSYGTWGSQLTDTWAEANCSAGACLQYNADGTATKTVTTTMTVDKIQVIARKADASTGTVNINVSVDGVAQTAQKVSALDTNKTMRAYTFPVSVPAGTHTIGVIGSSLGGTYNDGLITDVVHFLAADDCNKYASPTGADTNAGTFNAPFKTAEKLANSLSAGQTGCIKAGTYYESDRTVNISRGGTSSARNTLMRAPGETEPARINARINVESTADYLTLKDLRMDGSYSPDCSSGASCSRLPSPTINGAYVHLINNDISSRRPGAESTKAGICINAGTTDKIYGLVIESNKIHHCGRIPSSNHDHGIYLSNTRDTTIKNNLMYENADRAVQMYPDADRTLIEGNVMAYNGDGIHFSGKGTKTSIDNVARNNVVTHSKLDYNIDSYAGQLDPGVSFPGPDSPYRNEAYNNCVYGGASSPSTGGVEETSSTAIDYFYTSGNVIADPLYANPSAFDYRVGASSECRSVYSGP